MTAYDIAGHTIAYTTLEPPSEADGSQGAAVAVGNKDISSLIYPRPLPLVDLDEGALMTYANVLHVAIGGRELRQTFTFHGQPLRLYIPTLSLSPDGRSLITVAPVRAIPRQWQEYRPPYPVMEFLRLTPDNEYSLAQDNPWKASQYVIINLATGYVLPLLDAPAGRGLVFTAPTKAFWFSDSRHAIVTNTLLPLDVGASETERRRRSEYSFAAMVDIMTRRIEPVAATMKSRGQSRTPLQATDFQWDEAKSQLTLHYGSPEENKSALSRDVYTFRSDKWIGECNLQNAIDRLDNKRVVLSIYQDLNQPPVLTAQIADSNERSTIWNPNPQLELLKTSKVFLYRWHDERGNDYSGLLALPPDYDPTFRYPLVIQTHGYHADRYFADGEYTTGSGGRALCGKGIVVLQVEDGMAHGYGPEEGPDHIAEYKSAIDQLRRAGIIDPNRVGIIGFSRSCFHVLYALTHESGLFKAASITDGVNLSYVEYLFQSRPNQTIAENMNGGPPFGADLQHWAKAAPGFNLDKVAAPLLISSLEREALLLQWEIYSGLRVLKKPAEMIWLPKENVPHILVKPRDRYLSQEMAVDWFDFWLNNHEDPAPAKIAQYARWRRLQRTLIQTSNSSDQPDQH